MRILNSSEIWSYEGFAIHSGAYESNTNPIGIYEERYMKALNLILKKYSSSILDTAGGRGFPTMNLYEAGYKNITTLDGNADSIEYTQEMFAKNNISISVAQGIWQNLSQDIKKKYDVVLNIDNSLVYMDGWEGGEVVSGKEEVFQRFSKVLAEIYAVTKEGGMAVIGLGKHYEPTDKGIPEGSKQIVHTEFMQDTILVNLTWEIYRDWNKRHHESRAIVKSDEFEGNILRTAYLVTKEEVMQIMKEVGFSQTHLMVPDSTRDNLIIGIK